MNLRQKCAEFCCVESTVLGSINGEAINIWVILEAQFKPANRKTSPTYRCAWADSVLWHRRGAGGQVNETAWFYIDRKGPELKSEVCHLVVLWLSENQLTYSLSFLPYKIPKEGIIRIDQDDRCECI